MFSKIKSLFSSTAQPETSAEQIPQWAQVANPTTAPGQPAEIAKPKKVSKPKKKKAVEPPANLEKTAATAAGEPWVAVLGIDVDIDNLGSGSFNLDWNEIFVARLVKAGYKGKTDVDIVDMWFQDVCRNVVLETYEQSQADPTNRK